MQIYSNYAQSYTVGAITDSATSITVATTEGGQFTSPAGSEFELLTITDGTLWEVVKLTGRVGDVMTVERAYEGAARAWADSTTIKGTVTKDTLDRFLQKEQVGAVLNVFAYQNYT